MRYHNVSFMSQSCLPSFLYNPYIPFLICRNFLFTIYIYIYIYVTNFPVIISTRQKLPPTGTTNSNYKDEQLFAHDCMRNVDKQRSVQDYLIIDNSACSLILSHLEEFKYFFHSVL